MLAPSLSSPLGAALAFQTGGAGPRAATGATLAVVFVLTLMLLAAVVRPLRRMAMSPRARLIGDPGHLLADIASYRALFNALEEPIFVLDLDDVRFVDMNRAAVRTLGRPRESLIGATPAVLAVPVRADLAEVNRRLRLAASGTPQRFVWRVARGDGRMIALEVSVVRGTHLDHPALVALGRDVSERVATEATLRRSEARYRTLFEDDPTGSFVVREDGSLVAYNDAFCRLVGLRSPDPALLRGHLSLAAIAPSLARLVGRARRDGRVDHAELLLGSTDGPLRRVRVFLRAGTPAGDESGDVHGYCVEVEPPSAERGAEAETPARNAPQPVEGSRVVLLVEDEAGVRSLVQRVLERTGHRVHVAEDGRAGLELALELHHIDLLVTDVVMPRMYGTELADQLCRNDPALPVLFMSGYTADERLRNGALEPGQAFLEKPFTPATFLQTVDQLLYAGRGPFHAC